ncbi:MAG: agmatinase [Alphaproteobacteria bacterium]|nr:agmatinase [Alphaproteobacteria bacterium]
MDSEEGFLGIAAEDSCTFEEAKAVIIPFGLEASVSYGGGTKDGPAAMIKASKQVELFDDEAWCEPYRNIGIHTLVEPDIDRDIPTALNQLEHMVEDVLVAGKFPMTFGGEHSITAGTIRPFARRYPDLTLLHFDAHADLRDGYAGEHYSHAAALRRVLDFDHISLVSCGIRNISASEIPFLEANRHRIHIYWGRDRKQWNIDEIVSHLKGKPVYLTFDIDGFDASLMPATGTPEPGGVFWEDAMDIIRAASKVCTIVGADVNELAPREELHSCDFLAAKLAYKILMYAFLGKK